MYTARKLATTPKMINQIIRSMPKKWLISHAIPIQRKMVVRMVRPLLFDHALQGRLYTISHTNRGNRIDRKPRPVMPGQWLRVCFLLGLNISIELMTS